MNVIEINNLTKYYGKNKGVEDVTLKINSGEIYGFIGQNGAGKSTLIRVLLNMLYPTSGSATILGFDIVKDTKQIKKFLSYVPSEVSYYSSMKVIDLLNYSLLLSDSNQKEKIDELCTYFELEKNKLIRELSFGNKKKVSIIQALLKNPKVIILDEPTNGLDPLIKEKLFDLLIEQKEKGCCIFLSSHNLAEVEKYCDRVCIIKKGNIVQIDELAKLKTQRKLNVSYTLKNDKKVEYEYDGDVNELTKKLAKLDLLNLEVKYQSIEDEFMKFYKEI